MWNPDTYRDSDYGLGSDEPFEPTDRLEKDYKPGPNEAFIQTVLGPIGLDEAGVTLVHEHLCTVHCADVEMDRQLVDRQASLLNFEAFFSVGGRTIVDATSRSERRDAKALLWLAQHAPVHIVGAAGFGSHSALERNFDGPGTARSMREALDQDLAKGMDGRSAFPGVLSVASEGSTLTSLERIATELVAEAHQRSQLPVMVSNTHGDGLVDHLGLLETLGVEPHHVTAGSLSQATDEGQVSCLGQAGAFLAFDHIGTDGPTADWEIAKRITRLVNGGYRDQVVLSHGFERRSQLTGYSGKPGLGYMVEQFAIMLLEAGLEAMDVRTMLVDNASRALARWHPVERPRD